MESILFFNGEILTVNGRDEMADACLTVGDRIFYVGNREDAEALAEDGTVRVDLCGRALTPLFVGEGDTPTERLASLCERMTLASALRVLTADAARRAGEEREIGSLEWGKRADLLLFSDSLRGKDAGELRSLTVDAILRSGEAVSFCGVRAADAERG